MKLEKVLEIAIKEIQKNSYVFFQGFLDNPGCFKKEVDNNTYLFELHSVKYNDNTLYVMLECSRKIILISMFSKQLCFSINSKGIIKDITNLEFWDIY